MELMAEEKKEFKKTDLGLIPNDWSVENFTDYCWFQEGPGLRKWQFTKQGMKVINVTNLQEDRTLDLDKTDRHISIEEFENNYQHFEIDQDDIVMASSGNSYCKTSVVKKKDLPLMMNTSVIRFKPREKLDYDYLLSYLTSPYFKDQIDLLITGGAQPNFGPYHLKRINLPIPQSIQEQKAIGKALSNVDELIRSLDGLIQKKQSIKKGTMQQLLTGKKRLPGFDGEWEVKKIGEIVDVDPENLSSSTNPDYEFEYLSLEDVNQGVIKSRTKLRYADSPSRARRVLREGDVGFGTVRPTNQSHFLIENEVDDLICSTGFAVMRPQSKVMNSEYLFYSLFTYQINEQVNQIIAGSNYPAVNSRDVKNLKLNFPTDFEEQKAIAQILSDMDRKLQTLRQKREKYVQIKQGMMQELLTGKTRLV